MTAVLKVVCHWGKYLSKHGMSDPGFFQRFWQSYPREERFPACCHFPNAGFGCYLMSLQLSKTIDSPIPTIMFSKPSSQFYHLEVFAEPYSVRMGVPQS
ncbi:hypothetical protein M413DRAFT_444936 [Hebeloma cylindrosporum]|uniref:Uncharacterized protein n=1 Tax=Hebeloma cylindrosporum TaxID=76867 RepID=A0A0C2XVN2_HEBCY|nr:hypothetical protein M413DRAFT_444936 [Hebeloma cylindrosporum h7]